MQTGIPGGLRRVVVGEQQGAGQMVRVQAAQRMCLGEVAGVLGDLRGDLDDTQRGDERRPQPAGSHGLLLGEPLTAVGRRHGRAHFTASHRARQHRVGGV